MSTTLTVPATAYDQVVRIRASQVAYDALRESLGDDGHVRLTYDGEYLEIMTTGPLHEFISRLISSMLGLVSDEWDMDITDLGSMTFKPLVGPEFMPDGTWYINMESKVNDRSTIDRSTTPPPDILLETDITTNSTDKLKTFAEMRVPEVWIYNLHGFSAKALEHDQYVPIETSRAIAGLPIAEIAKRLEDEAGRPKSNMLTFRRAWRQWLRAHRHLHDNAS